MVLDLPGEYEVGGAMITGVGTRRYGDETGELDTIFSFNIDGVKVVVTGSIAGDLSAEKLEALGKVDALVIPVGDNDADQASAAAAVVAKLEPAYVVPVGYSKTPEAFLKELGVKPEPQPKLKLSAKELPAETQVVVLAPAA